MLFAGEDLAFYMPPGSNHVTVWLHVTMPLGLKHIISYLRVKQRSGEWEHGLRRYFFFKLTPGSIVEDLLDPQTTGYFRDFSVLFEDHMPYPFTLDNANAAPEGFKVEPNAVASWGRIVLGTPYTVGHNGLDSLTFYGKQGGLVL